MVFIDVEKECGERAAGRNGKFSQFTESQHGKAETEDKELTQKF